MHVIRETVTVSLDALQHAATGYRRDGRTEQSLGDCPPDAWSGAESAVDAAQHAAADRELKVLPLRQLAAHSREGARLVRVPDRVALEIPSVAALL